MATSLQYSCLENPMDGGAWWAAVHGVSKSRTWLSDFTFTFHFHALEKEMATHSSVLAWRIPGTAEPGGLPSMGSHRVRHNWSDLAAAAAAANYPNWGKFSLNMAFTTLEAFSVLVPPPILKKTTNTSRNLKFPVAQGIEVKSICQSVAQAPMCLVPIRGDLTAVFGLFLVQIKQFWEITGWSFVGWWWSSVSQFCPILCDAMDVNPPGSSVRGIFFFIYIFYWRIIDLQCFRHTARWFNYIYTYTDSTYYFQIISHYRLLQDIDRSSHCYTVNLCCFLCIYFLNSASSWKSCRDKLWRKSAWIISLPPGPLSCFPTGPPTLSCSCLGHGKVQSPRKLLLFIVCNPFLPSAKVTEKWGEAGVETVSGGWYPLFQVVLQQCIWSPDYMPGTGPSTEEGAVNTVTRSPKWNFQSCGEDSR